MTIQITKTPNHCKVNQQKNNSLVIKESKLVGKAIKTFDNLSSKIASQRIFETPTLSTNRRQVFF